MSGTTIPDGREPWHLSRSVPITLILAILVQTGGMIWWASTLSAKVEYHDQEIIKIRSTEIHRQADDRRTYEALARLDERLQSQIRILERVENSLVRGRPNQTP